MTATIVSKAGMQLTLATSFLKQFLLNPFEVGAMLPSSRWLATAMLKDLNIDQCSTVIEYGPGNGSFTSFLYPKLSSSTHFFAVEPNNFFADQIQDQFPRTKVVRDYADKVVFHLGDSKGKVDLIVSGLPFSLMEWETVERTILETADVLREGGHFRTFVYCHMFQYWKIRKLRELLAKTFKETAYECEIRNFPPAFVIKCRK